MRNAPGTLPADRQAVWVRLLAGAMTATTSDTEAAGAGGLSSGMASGDAARVIQHSPGPHASAALQCPGRPTARRIALSVYLFSLGFPFLCVAALDRSSIAT